MNFQTASSDDRSKKARSARRASGADGALTISGLEPDRLVEVAVALGVAPNAADYAYLDGRVSGWITAR